MFKHPFTIQGFTLIELVATMAIVGILLALAIPSFNSTITSSRLTSYANDFVSALNLARSEAVRRGVPVTVSNNDGSKQWQSGWTVNLCTTQPSQECILRFYPNLANGYTLKADINAVVYLPSGLITEPQEKTFILCNGIASKSIIITIVGRAHISSVYVESC